MRADLRRLGIAVAVMLAACTSADEGTAPTNASTVSDTSAVTLGTEVAPTSTTTTAPSSTSTTSTSTTTSPPTSTTEPTLDCGFDAGDNTREHAGLDRNVLFVPVESSEPVPLLLLFHGFAGVPDDFAERTGLLNGASEAGVALAVPFGSGTPITWEQGVGPADDAGFVTAVLDELTAAPCIDADNVWMAGYSAGAGFVGLLTCSVADDLAGIVMNAAVAPPLCGDLSGFDVIVSHGTADIVVPYDGLTIDQPDGPVTLPSSPDLAAAWATNLACNGESSLIGDMYEQQRWTQCGTEANTVDMLTAIDGGHRWPGRPEVGGEGLVVSEPDLTCVLLAAINGADDGVADCQA